MVRFSLFLVFSVLFLSLFGSVVPQMECVEVNPGLWQCSVYYNPDDDDDPDHSSWTTNIVTVCTNSNMSVEDCNDKKSAILLLAGELQSIYDNQINPGLVKLSSSFHNVRELLDINLTQDDIDYLNSFVVNERGYFSFDKINAMSDYADSHDLPLKPRYPSGQSATVLTHIFLQWRDDLSYLFSFVQSVSNSLDATWNDFLDLNNSCAVIGQYPSLMAAAGNAIDCGFSVSSVTNVVGLHPSITVPGSGGQGGVCLECYINLLSSIRDRLVSLDNRLDDFLQNFNTYSQDVLYSLNDIQTQLNNSYLKLKSIDDYLDVRLTDFFTFQNNLLSTISTSVTSLVARVSYLHTQFSNADNFKTKQGQSFDLKTAVIHTFDGGFNPSVYDGLSWFSRIEVLLASIAGVGSNNTNNVSNDLNDVVNSYDDTIEGLTDQVNSMSDGSDDLESVLDKSKEIVAKFRAVFHRPRLNDSFVIITDLFGFHIDFNLGALEEIRDTCRAFCCFIFAVVFLFFGLQTAVWIFDVSRTLVLGLLDLANGKGTLATVFKSKDADFVD